MIASQPDPDSGPMAVPSSHSKSLGARTTVRASLTQNSDFGSKSDTKSELSRRRPAVVLLAVIAMVAFVVRRIDYDSPMVLGAELLVGGILLYAAYRCSMPAQKESSKPSTAEVPAGIPPDFHAIWLATLCLLFPWLLDQFARTVGSGNGSEILMLASLSWGGLAIALIAKKTLRSLSLSVVASGFLVLFTAYISDDLGGAFFAFVWIAVCLWWLLNNHWSTVQCLTATEVKTSTSPRWSYLLLAITLSITATYAVWGRVPVLRKLQAEIMPTSGGTSGKDSAARSGVGDGDALVAARKHASSFGPVETDFFLDSEKPSLFDVFSEEFGGPKKKERTERAQALNPNDIESNEGKFAETNRSSGGNEFSIERDPPKKRKPPKDLYSDSLMFWEGKTGIRLAAEKFHQFDGTVWLKNLSEDEDQPARLSLEAINIEERTWFRPASKTIQNSISPFVDSIPEALRFTRFRSFEIPIRAGTQLWSIDQIDLPDFFAYTKDDCLFMPDRVHVPDYTVVRFVTSRMDQQRVASLLRNCAPGRFHQPTTEGCQSELAALAHQYAGTADRGLDQVNNVVDGLRHEFEWAREPPDSEVGSLQAFLVEKKGPSYLFATAAALMLDHLGYETRLVAGFYVSPEHYDVSEKATAILPQDAHTWVEINTGHGYWMPLEPTPGFQKPKLRAGLWYLARKNSKALALGALSFFLLAASAYLLRALLFALLCRLCYPVLRFVSDGRRISWLCWMLDVRWMLIGHPRPSSKTCRKCFYDGQWDLEPNSREAVLEFLETADAIRFGKDAVLSPAQRTLTHVVLNHIHRIKAPKRPRNTKA